MELTTIRQELLNLQDFKYQKFHGSLLPGVENIIGVRMPLLRKLAKEIIKGDWETYLEQALQTKDIYYEESILQALVIGTAKTDYKTRLNYAERFLPKVTNWAICDLFCSVLKDAKTHPDEYWQFIEPLFNSSKAYDLRVGSVMLLNYFTDDEHTPKALELLQSVKHDDYYVKMGVAWAISIFYIKQPQATLQVLEAKTLDKFTHNKSIQKICESYRVSKEDKESLKLLRI